MRSAALPISRVSPGSTMRRLCGIRSLFSKRIVNLFPDLALNGVFQDTQNHLDITEKAEKEIESLWDALQQEGAKLWENE